MSPDQIEALFRQQLAMLPPPVGIPPASNNPKLQQAADELVKRILEIMLRFGIVSPTISPPPATGPMASMGSSDLEATV